MNVGNFIWQLSATNGLSNLVVTSNDSYVQFANEFGIGAGNKFYYGIHNREAVEWEIGVGYMLNLTTLVRDSVLKSSNADALVNFSSGLKDITCDVPASFQLLSTQLGTMAFEAALDYYTTTAVDILLAAKSNTGHTHIAADVTDFAGAAQTATISQVITNGVVTKAPSEDAVFDALAAKSNTGHTHIAADVTDFAGAADARITLQKAAANGLATLDGSGKIPTGQLPALAITDTFVVGSQVAQTALTAEVGDVVVRTDQNKSYILKTADPSIFANWQELLTPTDAVLSVNGQTGTVVLTTTNIAEGTNLYYTSGRFNSAFAAKSTTDLAEGTNLYYTTARFDTALATKTTTNLAEGTNLYYTTVRVDAQIPVAINAAASKATPVDADALALIDSAASFVLKKLTWANLKATLKTYFDTLYNPLNQTFISSDQTITSAGLLTLAHGLSATPKRLNFFLICQTSENGFTAGDIVHANVNTDDGQDTGLAIVVDATNIRIRYGARATVFKEANFTTGARANLTNANWRLRVHAARDL